MMDSRLKADTLSRIIIYPSKSYEEEQAKYKYIKNFIDILNEYNKKYKHNVTIKDPESKILFKKYYRRKPLECMHVDEYDRLVALYFF